QTDKEDQEQRTPACPGRGRIQLVNSSGVIPPDRRPQEPFGNDQAIDPEIADERHDEAVQPSRAERFRLADVQPNQPEQYEHQCESNQHMYSGIGTLVDRLTVAQRVEGDANRKQRPTQHTCQATPARQLRQIRHTPLLDTAGLLRWEVWRALPSKMHLVLHLVRAALPPEPGAKHKRLGGRRTPNPHLASLPAVSFFTIMNN